MTNVRPIYDNVLIKIEEGDEFDRGTGVKGYDGSEITLVPEWKPNEHRKIKGIVVETPVHLTGQNRGIKPKVKKGDLVYFHYNTLTEARELKVDGESVYMLEYHRIFCRVKDGKIEMVGSWVLVEGVDKDIQEFDAGGLSVRGKQTRSGLVLVEDGQVAHTGIIAAIAEPNDGEPALDVQPGDKVIFEKNSEFENEIEGKKYFLMHQDDLMACVTENHKS
jgi:co-chaperonin GroES (HSP10)